jgi:PTH1 family peptidyl-tRNA hydrolase
MELILLSGIKLIVGLANPGREYENTRHNAGEWFVQSLITNENIHLRSESKYHGLYGQGKLHHLPCHFLIPTTFMNLSGQSVRALASYLKITPAEILVAHDEIDLPVGIIKLKFDGGDGGHNGLKDIIRHLNTKQFYRLRIGVGRPRAGQDTADYVLDNPSKSDRKQIDHSISLSQDALPLMLNGEFQKAMQLLHTQEQ